MSFYVSGGVPMVFRKDMAEPSPVVMPARTLYLQVAAPEGTQVYFNAAAFAKDSNFVTIGPSGTWAGPAAVDRVYLKGTGTAEVVGFTITG